MDRKTTFKIFIPALLVVFIGLWIRIAQYEPLYPDQDNKKNVAEKVIIPIFPDDPIVGSKKAPINIIAFEDLGCDGCKLQSELFNKLLATYPGKIKITWKSLTVTKFPVSTERAHDYAYCANEQKKFKEFKEMAFANTNNLSEQILQIITTQTELDEKKLDKCLSSGRPQLYKEKTESLAKLLNIQAVPALFIDNKQIQTPHTIEEWKALLSL